MRRSNWSLSLIDDGQCFHCLRGIRLVRRVRIPKSCRVIRQTLRLPEDWLQCRVYLGALRSQVRQIVGFSKRNLVKRQKCLQRFSAARWL